MSEKLEDLAGEMSRELTTQFELAQEHIRKAEKVLAKIPQSVLQNGAATTVKEIKGKLDQADKAFVTVYQSIERVYGERDEAETIPSITLEQPPLETGPEGGSVA